MKKNSIVRIFKPKGIATSVAYTEKENHIIGGTDMGIIQCWDIHSKEQIQQFFQF